MHKLSKRFFAFLMAMMMVLSCTAVASAAEAEVATEAEVAAETEVKAASVTCEENDVLVVAYDANGIMPRYTSYVSHTGTYNNGASYNDQFTLSRDEKIVTKLSVTGKATIKVDVKNGLFWRMLLTETVDNGSISKISNETFPAGTKVRVSITSQRDATELGLLMWGTT